MSFIGFNGQGYNSFIAESTDLVHWTNPRLAMGFGPPNEFDAGGCVIGAFLYESYDIKAPRLLKRRDGKYWTLYGCYPRQGGYELRPGYEGVACSDDGLTWRRAKNTPILAVQDSDCAPGKRTAFTNLGWWSIVAGSSTSITRPMAAPNKPAWPSPPTC